MRLARIFHLIIFGCVALALGGCGSGASDSNGTIALTVTAPAAASLPGTASATYTPTGGKNPIGLVISFSTDRPDLVALETGSRSVGSDGTASITFTTTAVPSDTTVRITASSGGLSTFQTITLTGDAAAPPPAPTTTTTLVPNHVQAQSITPSDGKLALKGTGTSARSENGFITFKVIDSTSTAVPNEVVNFTVTPSNNGGVTLTSASATTNSSGTVTVGVAAGATQATVLITATLQNYPTLQATAQFSITSGPPDQDSFSLAAETLNIEAFNHDGVIVPITVRLADHFNNPPPAGTAVLFTTNGGKITGSSVTDASGNVSVNWESQAPRPSSGRFVILAYAVGEESFTDTNGNGLADAGEFTDTGSAFRDDDADGVRDSNEPYFPNTSGDPYSAGDVLYNGMYQGTAYVTAPKSKHIFRNIELVMSTDAANITTDLGAGSIGGPTSFNVTVRDLNGNTMAADTTIAVAADNGKLSAPTATYTVPNNTGTGYTFPVIIGSDGTVSAGGAVTITVTSPGGMKTIVSIPITGGV